MDNQKFKTFEYLIGTPINTFDELPKQIDVLRLYFSLCSKISDTNKITKIVREIEKKYRDGGLDIKGTETLRLKTKRLVKTCKNFIAKRKICRNSENEKMRQEKFRQKIENVFEVARMINFFLFC